MKKNLTVTVPVYNTPLDILKRSLDSVDNNHVEVILLDDGSVKEVANFIDYYTKGKGNFQVYHQKNVGAAMARKTALQYVDTEYFTFVDCDDISHLDKMLKLLDKMMYYNIKVGNGRTKCFLPDSSLGMAGKFWKKEIVDFKEDKAALNYTTCPFWDKVYHRDLIPILSRESTHTQYHDMEVVYPALIHAGSMVHTNDIVYEYRMRKESSCVTELNSKSSLSVRKLLESYFFMVDLLKEYDYYNDYREEIDSIIIKLLYQRVSSIISNKEIVNKSDIVSIMLAIIDSVVGDYSQNKYYKKHFADAELNDLIFFLKSKLYIFFKGIQPEKNIIGTEELLNEYDRRMILKR